MSELDWRLIEPHLKTRWLGRPYHFFDQVDSTNRLLKSWLAKSGDREIVTGTLIATDFQSAGKGRLGRHWSAPAGTSLLFSALFRPGWPAERLGELTMLGGLAAAETLERETGIRVLLKWPNDILVMHSQTLHKVGGILLEGQTGFDDKLDTAILGIGINVNIPQTALPRAAIPATSLMLAAGRHLARGSLLIALLGALEKHYEQAVDGRFDYAGWRERLVTLGQPVLVSQASQKAPWAGIAEDTNEWGHLLVRDSNGQLQTVVAGDVTLGEL